MEAAQNKRREARSGRADTAQRSEVKLESEETFTKLSCLFSCHFVESTARSRSVSSPTPPDTCHTSRKPPTQTVCFLL